MNKKTITIFAILILAVLGVNSIFALSAVNPKLCIGFDPSENSFGYKDDICPANYAFYGFEDPAGFSSVSNLGKYGFCCPLPSDDILTNTHVWSYSTCPQDYVGTGVDNSDDIKYIRCTLINTTRYQLGSAKESYYVYLNYIRESGWELTSPLLWLKYDNIPLGIRYGIARTGLNTYDTDACLGEPFGALFSGITSKYCKDIKFKQLQYKGLAGDPSSGTPVKMYPDCSSISNPNSPDAVCNLVCSQNSDCGTSGYIGNKYCQGNSVYQDYKEFNCVSQACSNNVINKKLNDCSSGCLNGACVGIICSNNNDCNDNNLSTFDECNNPGTQNSYCTNTKINCATNNDCGTTGYFGSEFCNINDVFKKYKLSECKNPGTKQSYCSNVISDILINDCGDSSCGNYGANYCKGNSVYHSRTCNNKGCFSNACYSNNSVEESLVETCSNGCLNGACITVSNCSKNSDCGTDSYFGDLFCMNNSIYQNFKTYTCNNPGTASSYCSSSTCSKLKNTCTNTCLNGACITPVCSNNSQCNDNNPNTNDICLNPGTSNSSCIHNPINVICTTNTQCGVNGFNSNKICMNNNSYGYYITYTCNNPGTSQSSCSNTSELRVLQNCSYGCLNGNCLSSPSNNSCVYDSDCPSSTESDDYCQDGDVFRDIEEYECLNGRCVSTTLSDLIDECKYGCRNGECKSSSSGIRDSSSDSGYISPKAVIYSGSNETTEPIVKIEGKKVVTPEVNYKFLLILFLLILLLIFLIVLILLLRR